MTDTRRENMRQPHDGFGYWIKHPLDNGFISVSRNQYAIVERVNGFTSTVNQNQVGEPATSAFVGPTGVRGTTSRPENIEPRRQFSNETGYYDRSGKPITLEQYIEEWHHGRILCEDGINFNEEPAYLRTMYLGVASGQLFGTAVTDSIPSARRNLVTELETYASATHAYVGHYAHLAAIQFGHHCRHCYPDTGV